MRALLAAACLLLVACGKTPQATLLEGTTMGSAWTVKLAGPTREPEELARLRAGVQAQFDAVDHALSTYRADSALSRFNAAPSAAWQPLDPEMLITLRMALALGAVSQGSYDVTVGPLVDLWGFGPDPARQTVPSAGEIAKARRLVGWAQVDLDPVAAVARRPAGVRVDLSSLGKGRGVDRVAAWLDAQGERDYLVDLSGKLRAAGVNPQGQPWRLGVETPGADDPSGEPRIANALVDLRNEAIATAGDYRRYFENGGRHYSHLIDPRSGMPVDHGTASATVRAADCMSADAWATVLMVMPREAALAVAEQHGVAALLIVREGDAHRLLRTAAWRDAD